MRSLWLAATACVIGFSVEASLAQNRDRLLVRTETGPIRGVHNGAVDAFLGIPYGAPPVGDKRWRAPQPAESWTDIREANAFGAYCAAAESPNGPRSEAEDCLFINVWRPSDVSADAKLPVYVFIHGGGFINGSSNQADMTEIVEKTGVVGISFNYRLGALEFFSHPDIVKDSGDFGLMDQQAALRWVHDNIAVFGGDPTRVTIGGESAGGYSVCAHLAAPGSAGLFAQAMMQSGSCVSIPLTQAQNNAHVISEAVDCKGPDAAQCLRSVPVGKLIDVPYPPYGVVALPTDETSLLPAAPRKAVADGSFSRVAMVIGSNRDEGRTFQQDSIGWREADYAKWLGERFGDKANKILAEYPWPKDVDEYTGAYLAGAVITDSGQDAGIGGCANLKLTQDFAKYTPVYAYEFYNDGYSVFAGARHPNLLGQKALSGGWPEVAEFNANVLKVGLAGGTLAYKDQELTLHRSGRPDQVWMDLDYSPLPDDAGRPAGVLAIVIETTERVVAEQLRSAAEAEGRLEAERVQLALSASAIIGTWFWDLPTDRFTIDTAFAQSFGLDPALGHSGIPLVQIISS